ncbi:hypothetical protein BJX76DRAFT_351789 [Aspergillus varians]
MPKVRTGCMTCKQRRVKCDEGKPSCRNCARTGRRCEGYPQSPTTEKANAQLQIQVYNLPFKVPGSQADRQLLHFYCCEAAGSLSSFSDPTLWTRLVLQRSHDQPVIRHSLVTLAALYRDYLQGGNTIQPSASDAAMQRIGKCHRQLRLYLRSPDASPDTALICSILFYAFETLIGDSDLAIRHLNSGLNLLKQCQRSKNATDELMPHVEAIFSRLDIHASTFDYERMPILTLVSPEEMSGAVQVVPIELASVKEAEAVLTKLQNWLIHHIIAYVEYKHKPIGEFQRGLLQERFVLYQQFDRFFFALDLLLDSHPGDLPHRALLLRIQARMYYAILVENIPSDPSKPQFGYSDPIQMSKDSLRSTLADVQTFLSLDTKEHTPRSFTLASQLVAILYFLCLKTNDSFSRETAFALLQHSGIPAKDGLWESQKAVSIIKALIDQTTEHNEQRSLEETAGGVFDREDGGIENVFRELSARPATPVIEPL